MVSGELENSLRGELDKHLNARMGELKEEIARVQEQVNQAFTQLMERSTGETTDDMYVAAAISEHIRAAHERGIEEAAAESSKTKASSDLALIKAAVDDLDNQRTQADILNTLVNRAAAFAPRVAFFVIRNEQAIGWRARGFEGTIGDEAIREFNLPLSSHTLLSEVVRSRATWSGAPGQNEGDYQLLKQFGAEPPQRLVAVPLIVRNKTVAVLYADSAALDTDAISLEAIETLARVASMAVELLTVTRSAPFERPARIETRPAATAPAATETETEAGPETETEAVGTIETGPETAAEPEESTGTIATEATEAPPTVEEKGFESYTEPVSEVYEETASPPDSEYATEQVSYQSSQGYQPADAPSAATEFQSQPAAAQNFQYAAPLGTSRRYGRGTDTDLPVEVSDEEKPLHNDARRFARLLVSEIKLYNEQKVREGRTQGNIYERLREDIDRSREMYDKRVAPPVAERYDYFHQELVNTLAEGDPSKLGTGYPGSTASA